MIKAFIGKNKNAESHSRRAGNLLVRAAEMSEVAGALLKTR